MYQRILVPLDGSQMSEQVLPWARALGRAFGSRIELMRIVPGHLQGRQEPGSNLNLHTEALEYLNRVKTAQGSLNVSVSCLVEEHDPAFCISREARKEPDTLVAISTHGRMGIGRWVMGSVMDQVLRTADKPMLVVRPEDEGNIAPDAEVAIRSIIVPLDGSSVSENQISPHVVALAKNLNLEVVLLMVPYDHEESAAQNYLDKVNERLTEQGVSSVREVVRQGRPGDAIVAIAQDTEASIVAITTHGRSGVRRLMRREGEALMWGSIADRVVRHCTRPVLVVRPPGFETH
jgi:nucleotide-binding universal stress UspA family protein